ncbi:MAG: hypothetical protein IM539_01970 [Pseudanabaena sp. M046S1SP1A06QC]|nr:hypothetical protein [Pseudanabaena sp. M046S1SP1A06QC]
MPYPAGNRLSGERASKLGHLEVINSELVKSLCQNFENSENISVDTSRLWEPIPSGGKVLPLVFGVDGSFQAIKSDTQPHKELAFVKTALLRMNSKALSELDRNNPNPFELRDIMRDSAQYHATVFPLRNVTLQNTSIYHAVRQIIFESIKDSSLNGDVMETLKWIVFEKWDGQEKQLPKFGCPHCDEVVATLEFDTEEGKCSSCGGHLYLTDMLGFHLEMVPDATPQSVATSYMNIHETLMLFTAIRHYWSKKKEVLSRCLFVKDGMLYLRAQYSKLVNPIRRFLTYAREEGHPVHLIGQEKTGAFYDHLQTIGKDAPIGSLFIPNSDYATYQIHQRPKQKHPPGKDTNYGAKVLVKLNAYHQMVLNIPTGMYVENPELSDLIGAENIFATLPSILSYRYEGALLPIELANGIASLSTYPSAKALKMFAEDGINNGG